MTFDELQKANSAVSSTDIGKKDYVEVNQRIKAFRMLEPNGCIETELLSVADGVCIFHASVKDSNGKLLGTGTAYEKENSSFINKTSYIENCETSAVGRALAMCGIGIDASIASKEEVENAKLNQGEKKEAPKAQTSAPQKKNMDFKPAVNTKVEEAEAKQKVMAFIKRKNMSEENIAKICKAYKIAKIEDMTAEQCYSYIKALEEKGGNINE